MERQYRGGGGGGIGANLPGNANYSGGNGGSGVVIIKIPDTKTAFTILTLVAV
jgi:hypothetical protein